MKFLNLIITFLIIVIQQLPGFTSSYCYSQTASQRYEITQTDITTLTNFRSDKITVFGLYLGLSRSEAIKTIKSQQNLLIEKDQFDSMRFYVYDRNFYGNKNKCILYLIWEDNQKGLKKITIFKEFSVYLIGRTKFLLTQDVINRRSKITKTFLHSPHKSEITMNIPSIRLKETTYYYYDKWLEVTCKVEEEIYKSYRFSLVRME